MEEKEFLKLLCENHGPSGKEHWLFPIIEEAFKPYGQVTKDNLSNVIIHKKGKKLGKIMLMAHCDEVSMAVTNIKDNGFLEFKAFGIDIKTLVSQEVVIHGKKEIKGIIGIKPPHLMKAEEKKSAVKIKDLLVDTGYTKEQVEQLVSVGDTITLNRRFNELLNDNVTCKAIDDRSGIVAMYTTAKELSKINHDLDVYFVCSSQEEVGSRGAKTGSYGVQPDIGIAIDVTFDSGKMGDDTRENVLGNGPVICVGPNIHPKVRKAVTSIAREFNIPCQFEVEPGNTGTDAWNMQVTASSIATLLISIPIKYMHTSVEVVNMSDIKNTGRLIAKFIEKLQGDELEGLLCF